MRLSTSPKRGRGRSSSVYKLQLHHVLLLAVPLILLELILLHRHFVATNTSVRLDDIPEWSPSTDYLQDLTLKQLPTTNNNNTQQSSTSSKQQSRRPPDGTFNGYPIYYHDTTKSNSNSNSNNFSNNNLSSSNNNNNNNNNNSHPPSQLPYSQVHCIGETNAPSFFWKRKKRSVDMNWAYRSCKFELLCLDLEAQDFVVFPSPLNHRHPHMAPHLETQQTLMTNTSVDGHAFGVSIGGINGKWSMEGIPRLQWFPRLDYGGPPQQFYALPSNVTLVPFHSLAGSNPGHLVWDDFLPVYTLLQIFGLQDLDLLLMRYQLEGEGLWASCDFKPAKQAECEFMFGKFAPLMVSHGPALPLTTQKSARFHLHDENKPKAQYVCARQGAAGLGALTDHGVVKGHGWEEKDYLTTYNHGRGGQFYKFRSYLLTNILGADYVAQQEEDPFPKPPYHIVISEKSSKLGHRSIDFATEFGILQAYFQNQTDVTVSSHQMKTFSIEEQARMVSQAAIYITGCGGGAVTATFLPREASVIIYYKETGGVENNKGTGKPARLDWDYFNNMGYTHVHWMTSKDIHKHDEVQGLITLISRELDRLRLQHRLYEEGQQGQKAKAPFN